MTVWIVRDRRVTEAQLLQAIVDGEVVTYYEQPEAADRAKYPTETVWQIDIQATRYGRGLK